MKPGSRSDPWREFWKPAMGIYVRVWEGMNMARVPIGVSVAWTPQTDHNTRGRMCEQAYRKFQDMCADYEAPPENTSTEGGS